MAEVTPEHPGKWVDLDIENPLTWPPPFRMRIEACVKASGFPACEFHFFAVRNHLKTLTMLAYDQEVNLYKVTRWRPINRIDDNEI